MKRRRRETGPDLYSLRCETCGEYLVRTESGYLCCPKGHGRLQLAGEQTAALEAPAPEEPCWFDD